MSAERQESAFADTPQGWASRLQLELKTAREALKDFHKIGREVDQALRDEKPDQSGKHLCLFAANNQTVGAMLFGRTPQASVGRKFADSDDDDARVASEMLERVLNCDIDRAGDTFADATRNAMLDWRGPGLGVQRHRYELGPMEKVPGRPAILNEQTGAVDAPEVPETERKTWEKVNTDWVAWDEFLWGQCRTWDQVPWVSFDGKMSFKALSKLVGEEAAKKIPLNAKHVAAKVGKDPEAEKSHPWDRCTVHEVWVKDTKQVFFIVDGYPEVLRPIGLPEGEEPGMVGKNGGVHDPLGLEGFFPCQRPMMANLTTSKLVPVADYKFAQDLYRSCDTYYTRISILAEAVRLAGGYDKGAGAALEKIVGGGENKLYPVDNWAAFADKGGIKGVIDWLPLEQIVGILAQLRELLRADMDLLYQVTGQSDVVRGQQTANGTPGEAQVKAKFASVRMQAMQDEIARFASDGQRIRAEIIAKHFDPETIIKHSNIERTPDAPYAQQAAALLKSRFADYRVEVKPEAINLTDFAALKEERFEVLGGIATYFQAMQPVMQMGGPKAMPYFLKMLQITVAGLRGGSAYESLIDQWVAEAEKQAEQPPQAPPPDPKLQAQQMKGQQDLAKVEAEKQARLAEIGAEVQADQIREQNQAQANIAEHAAKQQITNAMRPVQPVVTRKPILGGGR